MVALIITIIAVIGMAIMLIVDVRGFLLPIVTGAITGMVATAMASVIYVAADYRQWFLWPILFAPMLQSGLTGAYFVPLFKMASTHVRGASFLALVTIGSGLLGLTVGAIFVGHSPHFSHTKAVIVLVFSWATVSFVTTVIWQQVVQRRNKARRVQS